MNRNETVASMIAGAVGGGAPVSLASPEKRGGWERALAAHRAARKALDEANEDGLGPIGDAYCDATTVMLQTPAPDGPVLLYKLEYLFDDEASTGNSSASYCVEWISPVMADAHRLLWNGRA